MANGSLSGTGWQIKGFIGEDWLWRKEYLPGSTVTRGWMPAVVPGSIHNDLWFARMIPDPYVGMNSLALEWIPERTWLYRRTFNPGARETGKRTQLVCRGVDSIARYFLNGTQIGSSQNMFLPAVFDITDLLLYEAENLLVVVVDPAPFEQPQIGYTSRVRTQKPRMNYWWDFCPRMIHIGIWEDVFLVTTGALRFANVHVQPQLSVDLLRCDVTVKVTLDEAAGEAGELTLELARAGSARGEGVLERQTLPISSGERLVQSSFRIDQPELWWPNGAGEQPLYEMRAWVKAQGAESDRRSEVFGIRRLEFVANDGTGADALPYTLVVNGRKIYINGWNWVPMDALYGVERSEKRERLLRLARAANVNLLRVWGGGLLEKKAFYDLCDRLGILVWQEFIQSSSGVDNVPASDADYIDLLRRTAEQAIIERRNHPSLAVWSGGNELHENPQHLCDTNHPVLAALKDAIDRLDPGRHWVATSPAGGEFGFRVPEDEAQAARLQDVHGPWEYQGLRGQYTLYNQGRSLLHSEFGAEGLTNRRALNAVIPPASQAPVSLDNPLWEHLGSWWVKEKVWGEVFGPLADVPTTQRATQFLQAEGLRYAVEADRRRQFANAGTMPWQFNEPYPMAACTSAVDYFAEPKAVYYSVARAYRPLTVTARFDTLAWAGEESFRAEICCSNTRAARECSLSWRAVEMGGRTILQHSQPVVLAENGSKTLYSIDIPLAEIRSEVFFLDLVLHDTTGNELAANRYPFSTGENLAGLLSAPKTQIQASLARSETFWQITLRNRGESAALSAWLEAEKSDLHAPGWAFFSDNFLTLLPGEERVIRVDWSGVPENLRGVTISGWNFSEVRMHA